MNKIYRYIKKLIRFHKNLRGYRRFEKWAAKMAKDPNVKGISIQIPKNKSHE